MPVVINGTTGISGVDGTAASPAIEGSDTNTGMFFPAADTIAFAEGGVEVLRINSSAQVEYQAGTSSLPSVTASGDLNTGIFFPAADTVAIATGAAEEFRIGPLGQIGLSGANYGTSGQVIASGGSGAGAAWANAGGVTLLGTLTTTSGSSQSLTSLDLTSYKQLCLVFQGVSHNSGSNQSYLLGTSTADDISVSGGSTWTAANTARGFLWLDLTEGTFSSLLWSVATSASATISSQTVGDVTITTASTSVSLAVSGGSFDAGSVLVYGVS